MPRGPNGDGEGDRDDSGVEEKVVETGDAVAANLAKTPPVRVRPLRRGLAILLKTRRAASGLWERPA